MRNCMFYVSLTFSLLGISHIKSFDYRQYISTDMGSIPNALSLQFPGAHSPIKIWSSFAGLSAQFPHIGHYQNGGTLQEGRTTGDAYNFRVIQAALDHSPEVLLNEAPESLRSALNHDFGKNISEILADHTITVSFYTLIWRNYQNPYQVPIKQDTHTNNVLLHGPAIEWMQGNTNFSIPISMGLFNPNGVVPAQGLEEPIAFDHFEPRQVIPHPADEGTHAASPNNARFRINPERNVVTFWIAAYSPEKKNITISFNIILNTHEEVFIAHNLSELLIGLETRDLPQLTQEQDREALLQALAFIKRSINPSFTQQGKSAAASAQSLSPARLPKSPSKHPRPHKLDDTTRSLIESSQDYEAYLNDQEAQEIAQAIAASQIPEVPELSLQEIEDLALAKALRDLEQQEQEQADLALALSLAE